MDGDVFHIQQQQQQQQRQQQQRQQQQQQQQQYHHHPHSTKLHSEHIQRPRSPRLTRRMHRPHHPLRAVAESTVAQAREEHFDARAAALLRQKGCGCKRGVVAEGRVRVVTWDAAAEE